VNTKRIIHTINKPQILVKLEVISNSDLSYRLNKVLKLKKSLTYSKIKLWKKGIKG